MPTNYGLDGTQAANFHYHTRLISSYFNKLFYNIFSKGIIPESGDLAIVDTRFSGIIDTSSNSIISINHSLQEGNIVYINSNPTFMSSGLYFVLYIDADAFKISLTPGGTPITLLHNGIVTISQIPDSVNRDGLTAAAGTKVKVPSGFSFFIAPNNRYRPINDIIRENFDALSPTEQAILEQQILKCDIIKDFYITPPAIGGGWIVAEFNYLEFADLTVEFSITTSKPSDNRIVLGYAAPNDALISLDTTNQDISNLNYNILYEMNVDKVEGYHAGNESGFVPISNGIMCSGLNTEMVNGYSGYQSAIKWKANSGLNTEYIADEFGVFYQPGNNNGDVPLSNKIMNTELNAELVGGSGYTALESSKHQHSLDYIIDGPRYKRPLGVNVNNHATYESFKDGAFTKEKINNECFFARNDDLGGRFMLVTGQVTLTANYSHVSFNPIHPSEVFFTKPPDVMAQNIDDGTGDYDGQHIKIKITDITKTHFTIDYTIYEAADTAQYAEQLTAPLTIQYIVWGYGLKNISNDLATWNV